jgi:hypothetical protein
MTRMPEITNHEWLLLSAYLDGQLSKRELRQVEEMLQAKPACREALEGLKRSRQVLRHTPVHKIPRNFTLTADMVRKSYLPSFSRVLSYSSALAGVLLLAVFALDLFSGFGMADRIEGTAKSAPAVVMEAEIQDAVTQESPAIIYWGATAPLLGQYGKGGGGDGTGSGMAYGIGGGGAAEGTVAEPIPSAGESASTEENAVVEEAAPAGEMLQAVPEPTREETSEDLNDTTEMKAVPDLENGGSGPILGIRPAELQGTIQPEIQVMAAAPQEQPEIPWRLIEIILAVTAILTGLAAFVYRKRI